jgi:hypothetical protein
MSETIATGPLDSRDVSGRAGLVSNPTTAVHPHGPPAIAEFGRIPLVEAPRTSWNAIKSESRSNARRTSAEEEETWQAERRALLDKKYESGLSVKEVRRLRYVEWILNKIEEARVGPALDRLEAATERFEEFRDYIKQVIGELNRATSRG